ncbi:O-acetyl-ADP-ribose deacetylase [Candidatus Latescibacterota bacterium]
MKDFCDGRVTVKTGDITREKVDAIVNAANSGLMGGGGVDGAIHRSGGPAILDECRKIRSTSYQDGLPTGYAVATTAGNLPAQYVIHTVGPVWHGGGQKEDTLLGDCYQNSLRIAVKKGCGTVAFPAISTGVYGFPRKRAAVVASRAVKDFLADDTSIEKVVFVFFSAGDESVFMENNIF